jgi:hypothetical protein
LYISSLNRRFNLGAIVKVIIGIMRKYGISKGAGIAKSLGFKTKAIGEAGKKAASQVARGPKIPRRAVPATTARQNRRARDIEALRAAGTRPRRATTRRENAFRSDY